MVTAVETKLTGFTREAVEALSTAKNEPEWVREWRLAAIPANLTKGPVSEDPATASCQPQMLREVYTFQQPQFNHNGGAIFFGTRQDERNLLYISSDEHPRQFDFQVEHEMWLTGPDCETFLVADGICW